MVPMAIEMRIDFFSDWLNILKRRLTDLGYIVDSSESLEEVSYRYFNLLNRLVGSFPRRVLVSTEFSCPPNLQEGLAILRSKIENGDDVTPHLSRGIKNLNYNDALLNDWGIHHLHLGKSINSDGFMKRTGPVLFARFDGENAYFIDVMVHGSWAKQRLIEILHRNWPGSIERFRLGVLGLGQSVSDSDRLKARNGNVVVPVEVESGVVYAPLGGGYATDGSSMDVGLKTDHYLITLSRYENQVKAFLNDYIQSIRKERKYTGNKFFFILAIPHDLRTVSIYETNSGALIQIGQLF